MLVVCPHSVRDWMANSAARRGRAPRGRGARLRLRPDSSRRDVLAAQARCQLRPERCLIFVQRRPRHAECSPHAVLTAIRRALAQLGSHAERESEHARVDGDRRAPCKHEIGAITKPSSVAGTCEVGFFAAGVRTSCQTHAGRLDKTFHSLHKSVGLSRIYAKLGCCISCIRT